MEIAYPCGELTRKHGFVTAEPFDAKTGIMSGVKRARDMEILHQRFQAELVAVRGLLRKAAAVRLPSAQRVKESRPVLLAEEPSAKKRKASPPPVPVLKNKKLPTKKMTGSEREMLAEDLESLVAEIPDHIVELLKKQSCATRPGEIEIDLHALDDAAVLELQEQVDKFARDKRAASLSPQERHQTDGPKVMVEEEDEEVDICGGVSPLAIVPAPPLQLVENEATSGSPSSSIGDSDTDDSSGSDSDSEDEEVDICGGVSPLAIQPAPLPPLVGEETNSGSPGSSSSGDSDTDDSSSSSSDSDDSEHSGNSSDSDSDSDEIVDSPAPAIIRPPTWEQVARALERQRKEATSRAREKARQEVLHTERTAMPDDTLHPQDVKRLGIDEYNTAKPNDLLRQIGLYLKVDEDDDNDWKQQKLQHQSFQEDLEEGDLEEGEIRS